MDLFTREWGRGETLIALHPLALESSAFEGMGTVLADAGVRTIAVDLPGFGRTPVADGRPDPATLAGPVIDLARSLDTPPTVLGISLGGRVALEVTPDAGDATFELRLRIPGWATGTPVPGPMHGPLYRELAAFQQGRGKALAEAEFARNRRGYHPICRKMVDLISCKSMTISATERPTIRCGIKTGDKMAKGTTSQGSFSIISAPSPSATKRRSSAMPSSS